MIVNYRAALAASILAVFVISTHEAANQKPPLLDSSNGRKLREGSCPKGKCQKRPKSSAEAPHDLNARFSKIRFLNQALGDTILPLHAEHYPMHGHLAQILNTQTMAVSCISPTDTQLRGVDVEDYIGVLGGYPSFPNKNSKSTFWDELREVVHWQQLRRTNAPASTILTLPDLWSSFNLSAVAEAVHSDFPGFWTVQLLQTLIKQGAQIDYNILPFRSLSDFVGLQVRLSALNTWAIDTISPINFLVKWTVGRPRPEEVAYQIATSRLTKRDGVPRDIISTIKSWHLSAAENFTAYPEGCPMHPAWPAMHSAAAASSFWISIVLNLTEAQECQAKRLDFAEAFGRTVAGVHYRQDNIAGLRLGQEVISRLLPDHLAQTYGSNATAVAEKIAKLRFDWGKFDPSTCSVQ